MRKAGVETGAKMLGVWTEEPAGAATAAVSKRELAVAAARRTMRLALLAATRRTIRPALMAATTRTIRPRRAVPLKRVPAECHPGTRGPIGAPPPVGRAEGAHRPRAG